VQLQDLVWPADESPRADPRPAGRAQLEERADEIAGGVAMNPYYRCFEAADAFVAVACLNLAQRRAFLELFGFTDPTIEAPDLVPDDTRLLAAKQELAASIASASRDESAAQWLERLESAGVPCGPVYQHEVVHADPQVVAERLVTEVDQPGPGRLRLLAPFVRAGSQVREAAAAPELGAHTESVLAELR
jgi:crotonobetainyl-CoA:carnitine CoA-transferase CaiB-like acyl-CoA transferase